MNIINRGQLKVMLLSSFGGMLEFYDFVIFAVFAIGIGHAFFPSSNPLISLMAAFGAFAIGYIVRPVGGIIFSHMGDKYGRKRAFMLSILVMACATLAMGFLPSYHTAGITMSILFLLFRIIQGMAIGAEIPGAVTFVTEHIKYRPGLACGVIFLFINLGIFMADGTHSLLSILLSKDALLTSGWRYAFILGGIFAIISYFLRSSVHESPAFLKIREVTVKVPIRSLLQEHKQAVILGCLIIAIQATIISIIYLYITSYLKITHLYQPGDIAIMTLTSLFIFSCFNVVGGLLGDRFGIKRVLLISTIILIILIHSFFTLLISHAYPLYAYILIAIVTGVIIGNATPLLASMFPTQVRYSGIALCYNVAFAICGGLTPLLATYWIEAQHQILAPAWIVIVVCLFGLIGIIFSKKAKEDAP